MYLEETNAVGTVAYEPINIMKAANRASDFLRVNPMGEVPALVLPDSTCLTESLAICKYLDELAGGTPVVGTNALERAMTDAWIGRVDSKYLVPLIQAFRSGPMFKFFENRVPGYVHAEIAAPMGVAAQAGLGWLDETLSDGRPYLGGERFTLADIRLYTYYKFVTSVFKAQVAKPEQHPHFIAYVERVGSRDSAVAIAAQAAAMKKNKKKA